MRFVSQKYKEAIQRHRTEGYRNSTYAEVYFGLIDYTAKPDSTLSTSSETPYSDAENMYRESRPITKSYATWEQDFFRIDGKQLMLPRSGYHPQGFVSQVVSDADGRFSSPPYVDIRFGESHSVVGLTLLFDSISQQYATEFVVTTWKDTSQISREVVAHNTDIEFRGEFGLDEFNRLRIDFTKTKPYQRIRLNQFTFGIGYTYSSDDLISLVHRRSVHPLSLSIPEAELRFTLFNEGNRFKVDSDTSIVRFLMAGQQVTLKYGIEIDEEKNVEWFRAGIFDLVSWSTEGIKATFVCRDVFSKLSETTYHKGQYSIKNPKSAGQLAAEVLRDAGQNHFEVSNETAYTPLPLPIASHAECLQYIANFSSSILEQVDSGAIVMRTTREVSPDEWIISKDPSNTPETPYSNIENIRPNKSTQTYATWEEDFFALDGTMKMLPKDGGYLPSSAVFNTFPTGGKYNNVGVKIDFTLPFSFGVVQIGFSKYSAISKFRLVGIRNGGVTYQKDFNVTGTITTVEDYFTNIRELYVYPLENPKNQRIRLDHVSVAPMVWPKLTGEDIFGNPKDELMPAARDVSIRCFPTYGLLPERDPDKVKELMRTTVYPNELTEIPHGAAYYYVEAHSENPAVKFDVSEHYAYVSFIKVTGVTEETEIIFTGMLDEKLNSEHLRKRISDRGTDVPIENPLSSSLDGGVRDQLEWTSDYYSKRVQYEVEGLAYPEVDAADLMEWKGKPAIVLDNTITFNEGSMRGTMKFRGR